MLGILNRRGGYLAAPVALERPAVVKAIVIVDSATLMQPISLYKDHVANALGFDDPKERSKHMAAANSYGTAHIMDDWVEESLKIEALPKYEEAAT